MGFCAGLARGCCAVSQTFAGYALHRLPVSRMHVHQPRSCQQSYDAFHAPAMHARTPAALWYRCAVFVHPSCIPSPLLPPAHRPRPPASQSRTAPHLRLQLHDAAHLLDLLLRQFAHIPRLHNNRDFGQAALAQQLRVAQRQQVDHGRRIRLHGAGAHVLRARLGRDQGPQLRLSVSPHPRNPQSSGHGVSVSVSTSLLPTPLPQSRGLRAHRRAGRPPPPSGLSREKREGAARIVPYQDSRSASNSGCAGGGSGAFRPK